MEDHKKADMSHFGFTRVPVDEKQGRVNAVFHQVADRYDIMNDLMSAGLHRIWKDAAVSWLRPPSTGTGYRLLDIAGGTGDMAFRVSALSYRADITVFDISADMLRVCQSRLRQQDRLPFRFVQGNGELLPFQDKFFDACVIAFGIRNMSRLEKALSEIFRVLKPGGRFICLEFSQVSLPLLSDLYDFYSFNIIPAMGKLVLGEAGPYQYLVESIRRFPGQERFSSMMREAGFERVSYRNLSGGVVAIHSGWRL